MPNGYNGKILKVNLSDGSWSVDEPGEIFYRKYLGGSALGVYYCLKEMPAGTDALATGSVLAFAPGVATGASISGASRFTVSCRSPLGGTIGDSQCGGQWGPALKNAGFDAIVVTGKSPGPVYLAINNGTVEIRDAAKIWGLATEDTRAAIRKEPGGDGMEIVCIGPAGERLVRFACISGGGSHYAGRTGAGAVMGSKNLKAIACSGKRAFEFADPKAIVELAKLGAKRSGQSGFHKILKKMGTAGVVRPQSGGNNLAARNFSYASFEGMEGLSGETLLDTIYYGKETCFGCVIGCKKKVKAEKPYKLDPAYGSPEFETIALLGSNLLIDDLAAVAKANELCNAYGMDTITTGAMISYAVESGMNGLIPEDRAGGLELRFGDPTLVHELVKQMGERRGLGADLAEGVAHCVKTFGAATEKYAIHCKGLPFPAHMAQVKMSQALTYAVNPFGADHMSSEHDWLIAAPVGAAMALGLYETRPASALDAVKARFVAYTQMYYGLLDTLALCAFCWGPDAIFSYDDLTALVRAATGWNVSFWELMKAGERRVNMMRAFNAREGFTAEHDVLPERMFEPISEGSAKGLHVPRADFETAKKFYYAFMGWNPATGNPTPEKLLELGLDPAEA